MAQIGLEAVIDLRITKSVSATRYPHGPFAVFLGSSQHLHSNRVGSNWQNSTVGAWSSWPRFE